MRLLPLALMCAVLLGCGAEREPREAASNELPAPAETRLSIAEDGALHLDDAEVTLEELRATANLGPVVLAPSRAAPPARVIEVAEVLEASGADFHTELARPE